MAELVHNKWPVQWCTKHSCILWIELGRPGAQNMAMLVYKPQLGGCTNNSCVGAQTTTVLVHKTQPLVHKPWPCGCTNHGWVGAQITAVLVHKSWLSGCTNHGHVGAQNATVCVHKYGCVCAQTMAALVHKIWPHWCTKTQLSWCTKCSPISAQQLGNLLHKSQLG
jgi:hypothetical protein